MQKILIVEDDEKLRNEIEIFFSNNGYKVETLKNIIRYKFTYVRWRIYMQRN